MLRLEVFDPTGFPESTESPTYAPRLSDLRGKTICEISDGKDGSMWEYHRTFPLIRQKLKKRFPDITFIPYTEFPAGVREIDVDDIGNMVVAKGCDAVIGGNAA